MSEENGEGGENSEFRRSLLGRIVAAGGGMIASFLLTIVAVRGLVPHEAAVFFAILAALSIGPLVGRMGLGVNALRRIPAADSEKQKRHLAGTHLLASTLLSTISAPIIAFIGSHALIGYGDFWPVFLLTTLLIAIESIRLMLSDIFAANSRIGWSVATMHYVRSMLAFPLVAALVVIAGQTSLVAVLGTYAAAAGVQFVVALWFAQKNLGLPGLSESLSTIRVAASEGIRLFGIDLSEFLIMQGTIWLSTSLLEPEEATRYALAVTLGMQVVLFKTLALTAVTPPASRLWAEGNKSAAVRILSNAATLGFTVAFILIVFIAALGHWAIGFAYGEDMADTARLLLIIAVGGAIQAGFGASSVLLIVSDHVRQAVVVALGVVVVAVPAAIAAAAWGGATALACVTAVSLAAMYFGQYVNAKLTLGFGARANLHVIRALREFLGRSEGDVREKGVEVQHG